MVELLEIQKLFFEFDISPMRVDVRYVYPTRHII